MFFAFVILAKDKYCGDGVIVGVFWGHNLLQQSQVISCGSSGKETYSAPHGNGVQGTPCGNSVKRTPVTMGKRPLPGATVARVVLSQERQGL